MLPRCSLGYVLDNKVAIGNFVPVRDNFKGYSTVIFGNTFPLTLSLIRIKSFDIIIGMYWLSTNLAKILSTNRCVCIPVFAGKPIYLIRVSSDHFFDELM